ncbi:MAG: TonB-dependent receptor plug domain-containing protein [Verrucomicrobiota bacterium]
MRSSRTLSDKDNSSIDAMAWKFPTSLLKTRRLTTTTNDNMEAKYHTQLPRVLTFALFLSLTGTGIVSAQESSADDDVIILEEFIIEETSALDADTLLQTDRSISSLGFGSQNILDIPRAVTPLSPETLEQYQITDVYDLARVVPGASVTNFYGVPGIPTTRGLFTSIYFNGMQRVWNRNGYPTSFGSLEAMEYVKGPPPPSYSAASPGGFVNFVPKSPYFDEFRGSVAFDAGKWDQYRLQLDVGGPFLIGKTPAAFRISLTEQKAESYYDGIENDYTSVYGSLKTKISDHFTIFAGGEFYQHRSKENPGWNRVTQDLIDNGDYIIGNPITDLTTVQPDGTVSVDRSIIEDATPFGGTYGNFANSFLSLSGFADSGFRPELYDAAATLFYQNLGAIDNPGAGVTTQRISGSTVLTDPRDFADADTYLAFLDFVFTPNPDLTVTNKLFFDGYEREKYSTYGYAEYGRNYTFEEKLIFDQFVDVFDLFPAQLSYGASIRYEDSIGLTDFTVEPFNRRDITQPLDPNTVLPTGDDFAPGGTRYWDPFGSYESELLTLGAFFNFEANFTERFSVTAGIRIDNATWETIVPDDRELAFNGGNLVTDEDKEYLNYSISPSFKITEDLTVYYTYQKGTSFQGYYVSGSVNSGDANFQESSLHEVGGRASLLDGKLYLGTTFFYQDLVDFDDRGGAAVPQRGSGVEVEATWIVNENLTVQANATWQEHYYRSETLPGGYVPLTPEETVDFAGIFTADFGGRPNPGGPRYGIPEWSGSILVKYDFNNGFGVSGGPTYSDSMFANPDKTLVLPDFVEWNASAYYKTDRYEIIVSGTNLTSEDIFYPSDSFAANTIITKAPPISWNIKLKYKF